MSELRTIVVVGASLAGLRTVEALRRRGYDGKLVWIGAEQHAPYDRPPLSKQLLEGSWEKDKLFFRRKQGYDELAVELRTGRRAVSLDADERVVSLDDGSIVTYDGLVIATGATPRRLPSARDLEGVHVLRTLDDAIAIRACLEQGPRVAVVGAGFVGLEVASSCRARGLDVTVVEMADVALGAAIGEAMGRKIEQLHRDRGVDLRMGARVDALDGSGRVEALRLHDGTRVPADLVVVGIGVLPATGWLDGSGLTLEDGVVCDATCLAAPGIVAAGDVARWPNPLFDETMRVEHWTNAVEQADAAAERLLASSGDDAKPFAPVPYFWSDQHGVKIQFAGRYRPGDTIHVLEDAPDDRKLVAVYGREGRLTGALTFGRPPRLIALRRQIGDRASLDAVTPP